MWLDQVKSGLWAAVACVVIALMVVTGRAIHNAAAFSQKADSAMAFAWSQRALADSLVLVARADSTRAAHVDTVRISQIRYVAHVDSVSRPDSTCGPSLAARNKVIASDSSEIVLLRSALTAQVLAGARLRAGSDTLRSALASRPHGGVSLEFLHPTVHLSLQMMVYPIQRVGVGLSLDLASFHL